MADTEPAAVLGKEEMSPEDKAAKDRARREKRRREKVLKGSGDRLAKISGVSSTYQQIQQPSENVLRAAAEDPTTDTHTTASTNRFKQAQTPPDIIIKDMMFEESDCGKINDDGIPINHHQPIHNTLSTRIATARALSICLLAFYSLYSLPLAMLKTLAREPLDTEIPPLLVFSGTPIHSWICFLTIQIGAHLFKLIASPPVFSRFSLIF
jgi:hypothetical protein